MQDLQQRFNIVDCFDFVQYDADPKNFYQWCALWKDYKFEPNDRILILNIDCDFYTGTQTVPVGNNNWNFFACCSKFLLPTEFFIYFSASYGQHHEVNYICQQLNLVPPAVMESICIPVLTAETVQPINYNIDLIQKHYVCLNGVQRLHRTMLLCYLEHYQLMQQGLVSFNFTTAKESSGLTYPNTTDVDDSIIFRITEPFSRLNDFFTRSKLDFKMYDDYANKFLGQSQFVDAGTHEFAISEFQPPVLQHGLITLVTESVFEYPYAYISEKTIKAMLSLRPFVVLSSPGTLKDLQSLGFKTFNDIWNEDYDLISNSSERLSAVIKLMQDLCQQDIRKLALEVEAIVKYNYQHYMDNFVNKDHIRWYNV
jgi:hypothetical protein